LEQIFPPYPPYYSFLSISASTQEIMIILLCCWMHRMKTPKIAEPSDAMFLKRGKTFGKRVV
jgi:hypothetical protein